jgi:cytochrome c peroxidase
MDLGLNNLPWASNRPDLPLFRIVCDADADPHSYLGREIYSHDPGRALITGRCAHVGWTMTQQARALTARAPYFANGSATTLREMVDFYDRRFNIGYTDQEKQDLINFMSVL